MSKDTDTQPTPGGQAPATDGQRLRNSRPTRGQADGGTQTPDGDEIAGRSDRGLRGLDKSGGTRGGGR